MGIQEINWRGDDMEMGTLEKIHFDIQKMPVESSKSCKYLGWLVPCKKQFLDTVFWIL